MKVVLTLAGMTLNWDISYKLAVCKPRSPQLQTDGYKLQTEHA